jgi:hypothetical protein
VHSTIEPGIYFDLSENLYHADPALGSNDMKRLAYSPCDFWFESKMNPHPPKPRQSDAMEFGKAVHKFILEGSDAFESLYSPTYFPGTVKAGKTERAAIEESGKIAINREDWDRIHIASGMIEANTEVAAAFRHGFPEVSIFWDSPAGFRKKCRVDYFKAFANVDFKTIRNTRNIDFTEACRRGFSDYRYDVQAEHYLEGRAALAGLVAQGAVHGDCDRDWLARVAKNKVAAVIVFYQAEGAPLTWGMMLSPGNPILKAARAVLDRADENYRLYMEKFGPAKPWIISEPLEELDLNDLPAWFGRT